MKPEAQRVAIAEACGWMRKPEFDYTSHLDPVFHELGERIEMWGKETGQLIPFTKLPDYLNDLNAMHEAEKVLKDTGAYSVNLTEIVRRDCLTPEGNIKNPFVASWYWHATAAQRAEAFLRCISKWEE